MPRKIVKVNGHILGFDDRTGDFFTIEMKTVPIKAIPDEELRTLVEAISTNAAYVIDDPQNELVMPDGK
jgi:hypothetical protein